MKPVLVLYATHEGHTARIARYVGSSLRVMDVPAEVVRISGIPLGFALHNYSTAIIACSVHQGKHDAAIAKFVKSHLTELQDMPTMFLSVSLSEAGAEDHEASPEKRAHATADVQRMIDEFIAETGWAPDSVVPIAGALMYTKYNFLLRFIMKRIARDAGASTDTSQDHVFTDWAVLDRVADFVAASAREQVPRHAHFESRAAASQHSGLIGNSLSY